MIWKSMNSIESKRKAATWKKIIKLLRDYFGKHLLIRFPLLQGKLFQFAGKFWHFQSFGVCQQFDEDIKKIR